MELINFSYDNKNYLFLDNTQGQEKLLLFQLKHSKSNKNPSFLGDRQDEDHINDKKNHGKFAFSYVYELSVGRSKMWRDLHEAGIDMLDYLRQNPSQVKIDRH
jgi:hypothetical protein